MSDLKRKAEEDSCDETESKKIASETNGGGDKSQESGVLMFCGDLDFEFHDKNRKASERNLILSPQKLSTFANIKVKFVATSASSAHSVIITDTGETWTWGKNDSGQLGIGGATKKTSPQLVSALQPYTAVKAATGKKYSMVLTACGSVFAFGDNEFGQCGIGSSMTTVLTPTKVKLPELHLVDVGCGTDFSMLVTDTGGLYAAGHPEYGKLGLGSEGKSLQKANKIEFHYEKTPVQVRVFVEKYKDEHPTPVEDVQIVSVTCGQHHTVAIDSKKRAYTWGFGGYGRLGQDSAADQYVPRLLKIFDRPNMGLATVACGRMHTIAVTEKGGVYFWGQLITNKEAVTYPKPDHNLHGWKVRTVSCGTSNVMVAADESLIAWGAAPCFGELGLGDLAHGGKGSKGRGNLPQLAGKPRLSSMEPMEVETLQGTHVMALASGIHHTLIIVRDDDNLKDIPTYKVKK